LEKCGTTIIHYGDGRANAPTTITLEKRGTTIIHRTMEELKQSEYDDIAGRSPEIFVIKSTRKKKGRSPEIFVKKVPVKERGGALTS